MASLTDEQAILGRAEVAGMTPELAVGWLNAEQNLVLGESPRDALKAGRLADVVECLDSFVAGRAPVDYDDDGEHRQPCDCWRCTGG